MGLDGTVPQGAGRRDLCPGLLSGCPSRGAEPNKSVQATAGERCGFTRLPRPAAPDLSRSVKTILSILAGVALVSASGCRGNQAAALVGTWRTGLIPSEWGTNRISVTYLQDGRVFGTNDFGEGRTIRWAGTYRVQGQTIERTIQGRTEEILYRIAGNRMHQKFENEHYTLTRVITQPGAAGNSRPGVQLPDL